MRDLKFAIRQFLKNPGFTVVAVFTLALGIGSTTAIFSVINAVLLTPLPYEEPGRLVYVWEEPSPGSRNSVAGGVFQDWREFSTQLEGLSVISGIDLNLTGDGSPERISGWKVSANFLNVLRVNPISGRGFLPGEDQLGQENRVVLLTHGFWQRRFGGNKELVGKTISLNQEQYTVVGILPPKAIFADQVNFLVPFVMGTEPWHNMRDDHRLRVIGRLKAGVSLEQAKSDLVAAEWKRRELYPKWKEKWGATVIPTQEQITGRVRPTLIILLTAVAAVLLIGCANIASLLLAKAASRQKEIAIRSALGATNFQVIRQVLVESILLALLGGALGIIVAGFGTQYLSSLSENLLPRAREIQIDLRVLTFSLLISLATGVLFGIFPALRLSKPDLNAELREGGRGTTSGTSNRIQSALVIAEVAISLVLLSGAGLLLKSFVRLQNVPLGFDAKNTLVMDLSLPEKKYPDSESRARFLHQIFDQINSQPGIEHIGMASSMPMIGWSNDSFVRVPGRQNQPEVGYDEQYDFVAGEYFNALKIPLLSGRLLTRQDNSTNSPRAVVFDEAAVKEIFPNENPLGRQVEFWGETWEIVGIVGSIRHARLDSRIQGRIYLPQVFCPWSGSIIIRARGNPSEFIEPVRKAILQLDPDQPVSNIRTLEQSIANSVADRRFTLVVAGIFAQVALLLAAIGLYGLMAYFVSQRTQEIGIRMALGAQRRDVIAMILRRGMILTGLGVAFGLVGSFALMRFLASQLYEVKATDPGTFIFCTLGLSLVAFLGCWLPTYKASKVDPMEALRYE